MAPSVVPASEAAVSPTPGRWRRGASGLKAACSGQKRPSVVRRHGLLLRARSGQVLVLYEPFAKPARLMADRERPEWATSQFRQVILSTLFGTISA
jgi:hypothetical protein